MKHSDPAPHPKSERLDAQTLAAVDAGIKTAKNGRRWTLRQAIDFARKRREEWKKIPSTHQTA